MCVGDFPGGRKGLAENVRGGVKGKIADVEAIAHLLLSRSLGSHNFR
jgi:hypothetical protein